MKKTKFVSILLAFLLVFAAPAAVFAESADPTAEPSVTPEPVPTPEPMPEEGFACPDLTDPQSASIFMMSLDTGSVIYAKNPDERRSMASLTKIMTFIAAVETVSDPQNTRVTVPESVITELAGTNSSTAGLQAGEEFTLYELLNLMLVPSANDAALTVEKYIDSLGLPARDEAADENGDGLFSCMELMNFRAKELGCENTHFTNSHGLYDENHYTTAREMGKLTQHAFTLPYFEEIVSQTSYTLRATNKYSEQREFTTTNRMLRQGTEEYYQYATGVKTGSLDEAGYCVAASGSYNGYRYLVVCLGAPMYDANGYMLGVRGEMQDARTLLRWAFLNIEDRPIVSTGDLLGEVKLKYVWNKDRLQLVAAGNAIATLPADIDLSTLERKIDVPSEVAAPVKQGDPIGTATFYFNGAELASVQLVAAESVSRSEVIQTVEQGKELLTSPWFLIVVGAIAVLTLIYLILALLLHRRRRRERARRVRRYRDFD